MNTIDRITMQDTNGYLHNVKLTTKELHKLQTPESKRTFMMGCGTLALGLVSKFVTNDKARIALKACACIGAIATNISMIDAVNKSDSTKAVDDYKATLREIARSRGFEAVL